MGKLTPAIQGKLIFFDSAPLIYYVEQNPAYLELADELFVALDQGKARGGTSVLTLVEVLTKPLREGRNDIASEYRSILAEAVGVALYSIDDAACERAARLRADPLWFRTPDALQLATAVEHGAHLVITNDSR